MLPACHSARRASLPGVAESTTYTNGFCDFAFGSAQNDSISGGVQVPYRNEGSPKSFACESDANHLALPTCAPLANRGYGKCYRTFSITLYAGLPDLLMEIASVHKTSIQLLTLENLFPLLPACHSARRASLPGVAESTISKSEGKPSPWREGARVRADEGWGKVLFPGPHPPSATVPPLPEGEGNFLDDESCDFAFRLRAE